MQDVFITKIHIGKVRHLENVDIALSETGRKHLILTGKNGSGKTSLLNEIHWMVGVSQDYTYNYILSGSNNLSTDVIEDILIPDPTEKQDKAHRNVVTFSDSVASFDEVLFVFISATDKRGEMETPKIVGKVATPTRTAIKEHAAKEFYNYFVNLDYQRNGAVVDGNIELSGKLNSWFDRLSASFREIFNCNDLKIHYDRSELRVEIEIPGRERFALNEMSDGYQALLNIYMELLMRLGDENGKVDYDAAGIVMIDEIETHLHVALQKLALPFLTRMFPNVQFIVATHSPFVITSLANAVVYDLENNVRVEDASLYSYDEVVEGYFDVSKISQKATADFERYKVLCEKVRTTDENREYVQVRTRLEKVSPANAELYLAFTEYERGRKNG